MSTNAARDRIALPQGTLDILILRILLTIETRKWDRLAGAIARILRPATQE